MKKLIALLLALVMVIGLVACGNPNVETPEEPDNNPVAPEQNDDPVVDPEPSEDPSEDVPVDDGVMSYAEYAAAELDTEVVVETYIQAYESWWDGAMHLYCQDEEGAYYIYGLACTEEEAAQYGPGTKIRVTGYKGEWYGEVEIMDATVEILEGSYMVEEAIDVTDLAAQGNEALAEKMNYLVAIKGATVVASTDGNGNEAAFLYKWDGSGSHGSDLYFKVQIGEQVYTFTVNVYMNGTGADSDVYAAVEALQIGDTIDLEGFLYFYDGAQPHVTSVTVVE